MRDFRRLEVWKKAIDIYRATESFPKQECYGLTAQVRRASVSISSNIAEGCGRESNIEVASFLEIASGSASEVECQLMLARDLKMLDDVSFNRLEQDVIEVKKMLFAFARHLREQ